MSEARFVHADGGLRLSGRWTLDGIDAVERATRTLPAEPCAAIDATALQALDTAGALLLLSRLVPSRPLPPITGLTPEAAALLALVAERQRPTTALPARPHGFRALLARAGVATLRARDEGAALLGFAGQVLETAWWIVLGRRKLRLTATVFHMERAGLDAVPIVALLSFLVGAVVAFLGATVLAEFGAAVLVVELVSFSFLREFGVLLTAILLAGRSGSAFTAELGMMKAREEIDAIRALGMDPIELLVIPRTLALILMLPLVAFLAVLAGILGGALVGSLSLGISPGLFLARLQEAAELRHFLVGMVKAPVFAVLIALTGCRQGLAVEGSAESVGRHTTASVVQAIFLVILVDALFAIFFREVGW